MEDLAISAATAEGTTTLAVSGELDPDSSGLSALVTGSARGEEAGVRVVVTNPSGQCERLLVATNLTHLLA